MPKAQPLPIGSARMGAHKSRQPAAPGLSLTAMPVQYTIHLLLDSVHGSLVQIEVDGAHAKNSGQREWLWVETGAVVALRTIAGNAPTSRVFDRAVLRFDGMQGELCWIGGRSENLSLNCSPTLRPAFHRLVHQHLN